jgi:hypothetical protein
MNNNGEKKLKEGDLGPAAGRRTVREVVSIIQLRVI